ncbi:glycosyltransferase family 2 protein [Enterococcus hailinensis]|uniref:glycosyltransferase family 2 protein n=1 Tax=Enterococcus hailinensis TaxID=3238988 RepID=UPI0038B2AC6C
MDNVIDVSIIIPVFNDSKGIENLLSSIDEISRIKEIIIIDDNSVSQEFDKIINFTEPIGNVEVIKNNSSGKGAGAARNVGLLKATGKWVLFADSDDQFLNNFTNNINKYANANKIDIVYFPPISLDEQGHLGTRHKIYESYFVEYYQTKDETALRYMLPVVWSALFNRNFIKNNNIFFEEIMVANDKMFSILTGHKAKNILVAKEKIYSWNYRTDSLTTSVSEEKYEIIINGLIRQVDYFNKNVSRKVFLKVTDSIVKVVAIAIFRNKFGVRYSLKLFLRLKKHHLPIAKLSDLGRVSNFFLNNKYYKKN